MTRHRSQRRAFLQTGACLGVASLAGCVGSSLSLLEETPEPLEEPSLLSIEEVTDVPATDFPIELSYEVADQRIAEDDPAQLSITLKNTGDQALWIRANGPPWPFSVILLRREDDDDAEYVTLWTDAYEESAEVTTRGRHVQSASAHFVHEQLSAGASVTEDYRLFCDSPYISAGIYSMQVAGRVDHEDTGDVHRIEFEKITIEPEHT